LINFYSKNLFLIRIGLSTIAENDKRNAGNESFCSSTQCYRFAAFVQKHFNVTPVHFITEE